MNRSSRRLAPAGPLTRALVRIVMSLFLLAGLVNESWGDSPQKDQETEGRLTHVSLEELGKIEVTSASKEPVQASRTPAAIYVITQEDIRRSGAIRVHDA